MQSTPSAVALLPLRRLSPAGLCWLLLSLAVLSLLLLVRPAAAQTSDYDLTVIAIGSRPTPTQVAATYSHAVKHDALQKAMGELARATRTPVSNLVLQDAPLYHESKVVSTGVEFSSPGFISSGAPLPAEAIVRAFPEWRHLRLAFITGSGFRFVGPADGTLVDGLRLRLITTASGYEYDVERTPGGAAGTASSPAPVDPAAAAPRKARPFPGGIVVVVVLIAVAAFVAAWRWGRGSASRWKGESG